MLKKLIYTAAKFGTFSSPTDSQIIYVDPNHADEKHHSPRLDATEAAYAFERGLIEDPENGREIHEDDAVDADRDPNAIGNVGTERTAEFAEQDAETGAQASTLESRSSTAWPDRGRVEGGADGFVAGVGLNGDASAQPADHVSAADETADEDLDAHAGDEGGEGEDNGGVDTESGDDDAAPAPTARAAAPAPAPAPAPTSAPKPAPAPAPAKPATAKPPAAKPAAAPKPVRSENP